MGAANAKAAYVVWPNLPHASMRVLVHMALVSLDDDAPPVYFAGRRALAAALGRSLPPEDDDDPAVIRERRAVIRAVDRVLKDLAEAGAIELVRPGAPRRPARYALNLSGERTTLSVVRTDHGERGPTSGYRSTDRGSDSHRQRANGPRPVSRTDHGERREQTTVSVATDHGERGPEEKEEEIGGREEKSSDAPRRAARPAPPLSETFAEFEQQRRAILGRPGEDADEDFVRSVIANDYVIGAVGELTPGEETTVDGMLASGVHPKAVVNAIFKGRGEGEADYRAAQQDLVWLLDDEREMFMESAAEDAAAHFPDASHRWITIQAARLARAQAATSRRTS